MNHLGEECQRFYLDKGTRSTSALEGLQDSSHHSTAYSFENEIIAIKSENGMTITFIPSTKNQTEQVSVMEYFEFNSFHFMEPFNGTKSDLLLWSLGGRMINYKKFQKEIIGDKSTRFIDLR